MPTKAHGLPGEIATRTAMQCLLDAGGGAFGGGGGGAAVAALQALRIYLLTACLPWKKLASTTILRRDCIS